MIFLLSLVLSSLIPSSNFRLSPIISLRIMFSFASLFLVGSLAFQAVLSLPDPHRVKGREAELLKRDVDSFIATEKPIALAGVLCNIGSGGACASGAASGLVIASPSKTDPPCKALFPSGKPPSDL
jgi:glucoamylase